MNSSLPEKSLHITRAPESEPSVREIRSDSFCKSLLLSSPSEAENGHPSIHVCCPAGGGGVGVLFITVAK